MNRQIYSRSNSGTIPRCMGIALLCAALLMIVSVAACDPPPSQRGESEGDAVTDQQNGSDSEDVSGESRAQQLITQASQEDDPARKLRLLEEARQLSPDNEGVDELIASAQEAAAMKAQQLSEQATQETDPARKLNMLRQVKQLNPEAEGIDQRIASAQQAAAAEAQPSPEPPEDGDSRFDLLNLFGMGRMASITLVIFVVLALITIGGYLFWVRESAPAPEVGDAEMDLFEEDEVAETDVAASAEEPGTAADAAAAAAWTRDTSAVDQDQLRAIFEQQVWPEFVVYCQQEADRFEALANAGPGGDDVPPIAEPHRWKRLRESYNNLQGAVESSLRDVVESPGIKEVKTASMSLMRVTNQRFGALTNAWDSAREISARLGGMIDADTMRSAARVCLDFPTAGVLGYSSGAEPEVTEQPAVDDPEEPAGGFLSPVIARARSWWPFGKDAATGGGDDEGSEEEDLVLDEANFSAVSTGKVPMGSTLDIPEKNWRAITKTPTHLAERPSRPRSAETRLRLIPSALMFERLTKWLDDALARHDYLPEAKEELTPEQRHEICKNFARQSAMPAINAVTQLRDEFQELQRAARAGQDMRANNAVDRLSEYIDDLERIVDSIVAMSGLELISPTVGEPLSDELLPITDIAHTHSDPASPYEEKAVLRIARVAAKYDGELLQEARVEVLTKGPATGTPGM